MIQYISNRRIMVAFRKHVYPQVDMSELDAKSDPVVAPRQLYGLTEDEVRIVEGKG